MNRTLIKIGYFQDFVFIDLFSKQSASNEEISWLAGVGKNLNKNLNVVAVIDNIEPDKIARISQNKHYAGDTIAFVLQGAVNLEDLYYARHYCLLGRMLAQFSAIQQAEAWINNHFLAPKSTKLASYKRLLLDRSSEKVSNVTASSQNNVFPVRVSNECCARI